MEKLGPIVFGAGAFNTIYNRDSPLKEIDETLRYALSHGVTAIDTAAYYGPSETIVGDSLKRLGVKRESYFLCTKAGRWEDNTFDYSASAIRRSVVRSLDRLHTSYIDLLYIHDVELQPDEAALIAIAEAFKLKQEGLIKFVGISGYPVEKLLETALEAKKHLGQSIDAVLSYCNLTLQSNRLLDVADKLTSEAGVKRVLNASPLAMSLLRSGPIHDFHPASPALKKRAAEIAAELKSRGIELADVAEQYAFANWPTTVVGMRSVAEVKDAIENRQKALENPQPKLWDSIIDDFGDLYRETWYSG